MTNEITLDEMINSDLIADLIAQEDKDLANDGWTYKEVKELANSISKR